MSRPVLTRCLLSVVALLLGVLALPAPAHAADVADTRVIRIDTDVMAMADDVHTRLVGSGPQVQYGTLRLAKTVRIDGDPYRFEVLAGIAYADGSGPWDGFMTLSSPTHGTLAMRYAGRTHRMPDGASRVMGRMTVIGGTGDFAGATGGGVGRAHRDGTAGAQTRYQVAIRLHAGSPAGAQRTDTPAVNTAPTDTLRVGLMGVPGDQHFTALPGGLTYGIGRLTGGPGDITAATGAYAERITDVELLGVIEYRNGSGPFSGFMTWSSADGSEIGMRYTGVAALAPDGSTTIHGDLEVIASSGQFAGMRGGGSVVSRRSGVVGDPLMSDFALTLRQAR